MTSLHSMAVVKCSSQSIVVIIIVVPKLSPRCKWRPKTSEPVTAKAIMSRSP